MERRRFPKRATRYGVVTAASLHAPGNNGSDDGRRASLGLTRCLEESAIVRQRKRGRNLGF